MSDLERIGQAIEEAFRTRAFGLYDYTGYPGEAPPHVVRNELTGERIMASWSGDEAEAKYDECRRCYVAQAAIDAMSTD